MPPTYKFTAKDIIQTGRVKQEDLNQLKSWCLNLFLSISDEQLILFILCCNNLEEIKQSLLGYFHRKKEAPELFLNRNVNSEEFQLTTSLCEAAVMPVRTQNNEAVIFGRLKDNSFFKFSLERIIKLGTMVSELPLFQDPPDGVVGVIDFKGVLVRHLFKVSPLTVRKLFRYVQEGFPCRIKQIHIFNTVSFMDKIIAIMKPFISKELFDLIEFHHCNMDMEEFFERCLPKECVPEDYGGTLPNLEVLSGVTYEVLKGMQTFYEEEDEQIRSFELSTTNNE